MKPQKTFRQVDAWTAKLKFSTLLLLSIVVGSVATYPATAAAKDADKTEAKKVMPAGAKVTPEQAIETALKLVPGKVTSVEVEKKRGKKVYTVEIMTKDQVEKDVFVDIVTGAVVGTE